MAHRVPVGILLFGSFNSPDMFAPAIIPVAAGKKTAKTIQNELPLKLFSIEPLKDPQLKVSLIGNVIDPS